MQLTLVSTQDNKHQPPRGQTARPDGFNELLAAVAAAQVAGAGLTTSATKVSQSTELTARQARLAEQTAEHRQNAADRAATRGADPGSVERGTVSARHERIVAHKAEATEIARQVVRDAQPDLGAAADRPQRAPANAPNAPAVAELLHLSSQTESAAAKPSDAPKLTAQPEMQAPSPVSTPAPPPAGVASTGRAVAEAVRTPSPAEAIGRILAGRAAEPGGRVTTASSTTAGQELGQQQSRAADRGATRTAQAKNADAPQRSDTTRQADFARLIRTLKMQAAGKSSSAVIRLDPPELGRVRINVRMEDDTLSVRVEAATQKGRELLQSRVQDLLDSLAEHNIKVDRLDVVAVEDGRGWSGSAEHHAGASPMQEFNRSGGDERRSDRRSDPDTDSQSEGEELAAALDARLDIRV